MIPGSQRASVRPQTVEGTPTKKRAAVLEGDTLAFTCNAPLLRMSWNNPSYSEECCNASVRVANRLLSDKTVSFEEFYREVAEIRSQIVGGKRFSGAFGVYRETLVDGMLTTAIIGRTSVEESETPYADQWLALYTMLLTSPITTFARGTFSLVARLRDLVLSTVAVFNLTQEKPVLVIQHAPKEAYRKAMPLIDETFSCLKQYVGMGHPNKDEVMYTLGKFYWMLVQTCPLVRGNAATTDIATRGIWKAIFPEEPFPQYKDGCTPDLIAIFSGDMESFARGYKDLFLQPGEHLSVPERTVEEITQQLLREQVPDYHAYGWKDSTTTAEEDWFRKKSHFT